jgi:hypothetical protein
MNRALQNVGYGVLTYLFGCLLAAVAALSGTLDVILQSSPGGVGSDGASAAWQVYAAAGRPVWKAVDWVYLNAHGVPMRIMSEPGAYTSINPLFESGVAWLYLVPPVACLVGGAVAATRTTSTGLPVAVGAYLAVGYVGAGVASAFLAVARTPTQFAMPALVNDVAMYWPVVLAGVPLAFGTLGAALAASPTASRLRGGHSAE